jgi:hypothetical protein
MHIKNIKMKRLHPLISLFLWTFAPYSKLPLWCPSQNKAFLQSLEFIGPIK